MAAAEKAAAEVLEEAHALHSGMRRLGEVLSDQAERMLRDVQAAHKRMQADLRVGPGEPTRRRRRARPARGAEEPRCSRGGAQRERAHHRRGRGGARRRAEAPPRRRRGNPFDDLDVPSWVARDR